MGIDDKFLAGLSCQWFSQTNRIALTDAVRLYEAGSEIKAIKGS